MKHCSGMMVVAFFLIAAGHTPAQATETKDTIHWKEYRCKPEPGWGDPGFKNLMLLKLEFPKGDELTPFRDTEEIRGLSQIGLDEMKGAGAYKIYGTNELYGAIINGWNYVARKQGHKVEVYETGDPLQPKLENVKKIGNFVCDGGTECRRPADCRFRP